MLRTKAILERKESTFGTRDCVIEKVIRLSGAEYDRFASDMLADQDFIKENAHLCRPDSSGRLHCLLVVGEGRRDGVLVDSSGYDYARYSAFIPNAEDFLTVGQSPALAALNKRLTEIVDVIAEQAGAGSPTGRGSVDLRNWSRLSGIDLEQDGTLRSTFLNMLSERPEITDFEIDKNALTVYRQRDGQDGLADAGKPSVMERIKASRDTRPTSKDTEDILPFDDFVSKCRMPDEACRQWCAFIDEAPERRDGERFTEFFNEICEQKYQEYLEDPDYRADCNHTAAMGEKDADARNPKKGKGGPEL